MTVRKDDKAYVLVETTVPPSKESKEDSQTSASPVLQTALSMFAASKLKGGSIARLPNLLANIERTHTFRYVWVLSSGNNTVEFNSNHIASPLAFATSTTAARALFCSGRLRKLKIIWADWISGSGEVPPISNAPELSWYPAPGSTPFAKREVIVGSPSTSAGGGMLTAVPPKGSWQGMWQNPISATPIPYFTLETGVVGNSRALALDLTIDLVMVAGIGSNNAVPSLTVAGATADKIVQLVPLVNGTTAGDAQGYYTANY